MFRWLSGPGEAFKQALPGSTNYLNAYDRNGNLMRARNVGARKVRASGLKEDEEKEKVGARALPRETTEDLMPFPLNRRFWSQAVLSEELKDSVWKRVMEDGKSVRDVSAVLGVEMRRVAAVVRLKAVEKEWEKQVCEPTSLSPQCLLSVPFSMMRKNISISLEDYTMVTKNNYNSLTRWILDMHVCTLFFVLA